MNQTTYSEQEMENENQSTLNAGEAELESEFEKLTQEDAGSSEAEQTNDRLDEESLEQDKESETSGDGQPEVNEDIEDSLSTKDLETELQKLKAERDYFKHAHSADRGRVSALQKKINAMEAQMQTLNQAPANPTGSGMTDEAWASFAQTYPEMAAAMEARLKDIEQHFKQQLEAQVNSRLAEVEQEVQPLKIKAHEDFLQQQFSVLGQKHPDWEEVVASAQFQEWIGRQPADMQARLESEDAMEASYLLDVYKAMNAGSQQAQPNPLQAQRQQRLQQSVGVKQKGSGQAVGVPDDYESAFNFYASQS